MFEILGMRRIHSNHGPYATDLYRYIFIFFFLNFYFRILPLAEKLYFIIQYYNVEFIEGWVGGILLIKTNTQKVYRMYI